MLDKPIASSEMRRIVTVVQEAVNKIDFSDMKESQKKEYAKAGARRVIGLVNDALDKLQAAE